MYPKYGQDGHITLVPCVDYSPLSIQTKRFTLTLILLKQMASP